MSSLEACIRKAGKALTKEDAAAIRAIRDDMVAAGNISPGLDVNQMAVDDYLDILQDEKDFIMRQVEALGATTADKSLSPSKFAEESTKNLEEAARKFPRKGIYRPAAETGVFDYKTGERLNERFRGAASKGKDPNIVIDTLTERTHKTVEMLYPDFYSLPPDQVLAIVNTFDPKAALGIAKAFGTSANSGQLQQRTDG
jgi:hypothetical protein